MMMMMMITSALRALNKHPPGLPSGLPSGLPPGLPSGLPSGAPRGHSIRRNNMRVNPEERWQRKVLGLLIMLEALIAFALIFVV